ncbi:hypothetical protein RM780_17515 [Streptomyces sp. DSM 44917]|uniref:PE domain-containing protein n=1 Tax=Streptomyces boetiae TaxID=3075541 RepID=A0ABU2LAZ6_9ACTN|nr:hypothetical protein [Streptomyces sp. DSM 44917]MDT0308746.1 hypothetical protein [Streptomyces sp. DSM 44917]
MPNISITYAEVEEAAAAMRASNRDVLTPAKDAAKTAIDAALTESLVMPETGAAISEMYTNLHTSLTELCTAVDSFAQQFIDIKNNMMEFDSDYADNIRNPR